MARPAAPPALALPLDLSTCAQRLLRAHLAVIPGRTLPTRESLALTLATAAVETLANVQGPGCTRLAWHGFWPVPWTLDGQLVLAHDAIVQLQARTPQVPGAPAGAPPLGPAGGSGPQTPHGVEGTGPLAGVRGQGPRSDDLFPATQDVQRLLRWLQAVLAARKVAVDDVRRRLSAAVQQRWEKVQQTEALWVERTKALQFRRLLPTNHALDEHQERAVAWLLQQKGNGLLQDEQGIGKTISAIGWLLERLARGDAPYPLMVVCPSSVCGAWEDALSTWLSVAGRPSIAVVDRKDASTDADVVIVPWSRLAKAEGLQRPWRQVIADECQAAINLEAQRSFSLWAIRGEAPLLELSGTPTNNGRGKEWWGHLVLLRGTEGVSKDRFLRNYGDPKTIHLGKRKVTKTDGLSREADLVATHLAPRVLRREKSELKDKLPPKTRVVLPVRLPPPAVARLARAKDLAKASYQRKIEERHAELVAQGLSMDAIEAKLDGMRSAEALAQIGQVRLQTGLEKIPAVVEWVLERTPAPVVLFCEHREVQAQLVAALKKAGVDAVAGRSEDSPADRKALVDRFQTGQIPAVVLTRAFSAGVTLTAARSLGMVERYWLPLDEYQAEDRVHRRGQTQDVEIAYFRIAGAHATDDMMHGINTWKEVAIATTNGSAAQRAMTWLESA